MEMSGLQKIMRTRGTRSICIVLTLFICSVVCAVAPARELDQAELFDEHHLLEIEVVISPENWDKLRLPRRQPKDVFEISRDVDEMPEVFEYLPADLVINGISIGNIGIKKKGFFGSMDEERPSLKIKFDEFVEDRRIAGLKRLTLNNNKQDASRVHQYLAYKLFRQAGVPSLRCNFARVTVNGKYLGVYTHVESVDKQFLKRNFGKSSGNLYEGAITDFIDGWIGSFETKSSVKNNDREDLKKMVTALKLSDEDLMSGLGEVLDLDAFLSYWTVEVLLGHWDGYAGNQNNFFVYRPKKNGRFTFIPWGTDQIAAPKNPLFWDFDPPKSVWAGSAVTHRLYHHPEGRRLYRERMQKILNERWDEEQILADIQRLDAFLKPHLTVPDEAHQDALDLLRTYVQNRRGEVQNELDGPAPAWEHPLTEPGFLKESGTVTVSFNSVWHGNANNEDGDLDPFNDPGFDSNAVLTMNYQGEPVKFEATGSFTAADRQNRPQVRFIGRKSGEAGKCYVMGLTINPDLEGTGGTDEEAEGWLVEIELGKQGFKYLGRVQGTIHYEETSLKPNGRVAGRADLRIHSMSRKEVFLTGQK
jgi:hypothetical protein